MANGRTLKANSEENPLESLTLVELMAKYIRYLKQTYATFAEPGSEPYRVLPVLKLLRGSYGSDLSADFGPLKLKAFRQQLVDKGQCRSYVNANVRRVRAMFR